MIQQLGDFPVNAIVRFLWATNGQDGASITRGTNGSIRIYKNDSTTERSSAAGITDTEDLDTQTGVHHLKIDLSDNTDAGFYVAGSDYFVVLNGAVIDTKTVNVPLAQFSIGKKPENQSTVRGVVTTGATTTSIPTSSLSPAAAVTDQFKGRIVVFDNDTATANLRGQGSDITGSTSGGTLTVTALTTAPASGDTFKIY